MLGLVLAMESEGSPRASIGGGRVGPTMLVLNLVLAMEGESNTGATSAWSQMGVYTLLMLGLVLLVVVEGKGSLARGVLDAIVLILGLLQSSDDTRREGHYRREGGAVGKRVAGEEI